MSTSNTAKITELLQKFKSLEASGAAKSSHPDHDARNVALDELQDLVGYAGKMVMERDIVKKAEQILATSK